MTRLEEIHRPMSVEDFHDLPLRPGWKHEYWDDCAHITPAGIVLPQVLALGSTVPPPDPPPTLPAPAARLRLLEERDDPALIELFVAAFTGAMEYVDCCPERVRESAEESLARPPRKRRGARHPVSYVAEARGEIVAATLFRHGRQGPLLDLIFTSPRHQRQGLGSALFARALADFAAGGEARIWSSVMLGNEPSLAWHRRVGFVEVPHLIVARHRRMIYRAELERCRRLGILSPAAEAEPVARVAHWEEEARRLDRLFRQDPLAAFPDIY